MPSTQVYCRRAAMVMMAVNLLNQADAGVAGSLTSRIQADLDIPEDADGFQQVSRAVEPDIAGSNQKRDDDISLFSNTLNEAALAGASSGSGHHETFPTAGVLDLEAPTPIVIKATPATSTSIETDVASGTPTNTPSALAGQGKKNNNGKNNNNNQRTGKGKGKRGKNNGKRNRSGRRRCRRRGRGKRNGKQNRAGLRRCRRRGGRRGKKNNAAKNNRANGVTQRAIEDGVLTAYADDGLGPGVLGVNSVALGDDDDLLLAQDSEVDAGNDLQLLQDEDDDSDNGDDGEDEDEEA